ncbi:inner membrane protein YrbG [bacterium BMS3Bbin10]|nr:inner membrane protein YrbG [bacterium BMS3Bbin10]HDL16974.1 sodium:calcium antiporter [Hyphomicrobiales bacterium]
MTDFFAGLPMAANFALFALAAAGVWLAGSRLPLYADAISDRKRIGKAFIGLVFLAGATSLPEIVATLTAAITNKPGLVLGTLFGGIAMQTAVLALADAVAAPAALTHFPRKLSSALEATMLALLLALLLAIATVGDVVIILDLGVGTTALGLAYAGVLVILNRYEGTETWQPVEIPETHEELVAGVATRELDEVSLRGLALRFAAGSFIILVCGLMLTATASALAEQTGLGTSMLGVTLLALSTSLPEVSTTFAAVRLGAYTMAISNIFGSNLLMVALVLPADLAFRGGPVLDAIDRTTTLALVSGLAVTTIFLAGLLIRSPRRIAGMGIDSALVLGGYLLTLVAFYYMT